MFRALALIFGFAGLVVLVIDLAGGLMGGGGPMLQPLGAWWLWADRDSLLLLQPAIERHISPALWDPGVQTILEWPAALEFLGLAALFGLAALWRRRATRGEPAAGR